MIVFVLRQFSTRRASSPPRNGNRSSTPNLWKTYLLPGIQGTLTAAALSIVLALVLGFVLGMGRLSLTA